MSNMFPTGAANICVLRLTSSTCYAASSGLWCPPVLQVFQLSEIRAVVVLICGCCPGGNLSNIMTLALKGDMNLR